MASKTVDEGDDFVQKKETWKDFLFDSDKKTVLGRTGLSWLKITVFYLFFYLFLVGWFTGLLHAFYNSLDDVKPTYWGESSLTLANPAMGVRPMPIYDSTMIRFSQGKVSSFKPYTDHLTAFFKTYEYNPKAMNCTGNDTVSEKVGCNVDVQQILKDAGCAKKDHYGYLDGKPCVAVKMNKLYGFEPEPYGTLSEIEADLTRHETVRHRTYSDGNIGVTCDGQNAVDRQHLMKVDLYPKDTGLDMKYFPYLNQKFYRSPIIIVKFSDVKKRVVIQVTCKLWAKNIDNSDGKQKRGTVHFELYIN